MSQNATVSPHFPSFDCVWHDEADTAAFAQTLAAQPALANAYITWLTSPQGQAFFEQAGFIPAISPKGQELIEKLGVKDVA